MQEEYYHCRCDVFNASAYFDDNGTVSISGQNQSSKCQLFLFNSLSSPPKLQRLPMSSH